MIDQKIETAEQALALITTQIAQGLTPVMAGTSFYRHSFRASQFGDYLYYLDERGTAGCCRPFNLLRTFDFIDLGLPVPGSMPDLPIPVSERGRSGLVVAFVPGLPEPTLLQAATAALRVMPDGPEREDLERAIIRERRIH